MGQWGRGREHSGCGKIEPLHRCESGREGSQLKWQSLCPYSVPSPQSLSDTTMTLSMTFCSILCPGSPGPQLIASPQVTAPLWGQLDRACIGSCHTLFGLSFAISVLGDFGPVSLLSVSLFLCAVGDIVPASLSGTGYQEQLTCNGRCPGESVLRDSQEEQSPGAPGCEGQRGGRGRPSREFPPCQPW